MDYINDFLQYVKTNILEFFDAVIHPDVETLGCIAISIIGAGVLIYFMRHTEKLKPIEDFLDEKFQSFEDIQKAREEDYRLLMSCAQQHITAGQVRQLVPPDREIKICTADGSSLASGQNRLLKNQYNDYRVVSMSDRHISKGLSALEIRIDKS